MASADSSLIMAGFRRIKLDDLLCYIMVDTSRVDALLEGLAHRQQAGISMHGDSMTAFSFRHQNLHAAKALLCTVY